MFHSSIQKDDDNHSVDPVQPTVIPITNTIPIRKSPSLSMNNPQNNLLELLQQLQQQQQQQQQQPPPPTTANQLIRTSVSPSVVPVDIPIETVVPVDVLVTDVIPSVSPNGSGRSNTSIPLGTIQTDISGNQIINT